MVTWLKGKKTFIMAGATVAWALLSWALGKDTMVHSIDLSLAALVAAGLRAGLADSIRKVLSLMEDLETLRANKQ